MKKIHGAAALFSYFNLNNLFHLYELLTLSVDYPSFCHYNKTNVKIG